MRLHEDLHAATQVPAQLVGSATACMRWWRFSRCGPDGGPAGVLGKGLAGAPARVLPRRLLSSPARCLPGAWWFSSVGIPPRVVIFYSVYLILNVFTKICIPPWGCLPNPCPMGAVDSRVIRSVGVGRAATARALTGLLKPPLGKDLVGGICFVPFALRGLGLGVVVLLSFGLTLAHPPCLAWCGGARGSDCPCTVIGVQKVHPSFCTPTSWNTL